MSEINLPNLPDTNNTLIPPNTIFDVPIADVPYLDPLLLPSLEQIDSGLGTDKLVDFKTDKNENLDANAAAKELIPTNLPNVENELKTEESVATFNIPFFGEFPVPAPEVIASSVIAAGTASIVSVGGGIAMQAVLGQIKKIFKKIFTKVLKKEVSNFQKKDQNSDEHKT